jgi:ATP synthase protein I
MNNMDKQKRKLKEISGKIDSYKSGRSDINEKYKEKRGKQISLAMRLSTELVVSCVVGAVLGWYIDKWLDTKPIFFIILLILGIISGIKTAVNTSRQMYEDIPKSK